jgi:hypothetical protein
MIVTSFFVTSLRIFDYWDDSQRISLGRTLTLRRVFWRLGVITGLKTRLQPAGVGIGCAAVSVHRIDLLQLILPMFTRLRWQGPADVDFKIDSRTGQAWLIEVNARFSGSVEFAIACGVNLPFISCQAAMGLELPESTTPAYPEGVKYCNPIMYTTRSWLPSGAEIPSSLCRRRSAMSYAATVSVTPTGCPTPPR